MLTEVKLYQMQFQEDDNVALTFKFIDLLGNVREKGLGVIIVVNNLNLFAFTKKTLVQTQKKGFSRIEMPQMFFVEFLANTMVANGYSTPSSY